MTTKVHSNILSLNGLLLKIVIIVIKSTKITKVSKTWWYLITEFDVLSKPLIIIFIVILASKLAKIYWITSWSLASKGFKFFSTLRFYTTTASLSKKCRKIDCCHTTVLSMWTTANSTRFKSIIENVIAMSAWRHAIVNNKSTNNIHSCMTTER